MASFSSIWSITSFRRSDLSEYAETSMFSDTRRGIIVLCWVLFALLVSSAALYYYLGYDRIYVYSSSILAVLSLHMSISVRAISETRVLYLLATTLIVIIGVAMVLLAHQSGGFNAALFASVVLLFLVMPLVPWGLREALLIVVLVYAVFTFSTLSVEGKFDSETLWILQFVMLGASLTTLVVISRNIQMRKDDIKMRFELKKAHDHMQMLSLKDPLTGAWNRRFLEQKFDSIIVDFQQSNHPIYFVTIDINDFKPLNDKYGHEFGDRVLQKLVTHFKQTFTEHEYLIRMGGDEFALLMTCSKPQHFLNIAAKTLLNDPELQTQNSHTQIHVSMGVIQIDSKQPMSLSEIYRKADRILYRAKEKKGELPEQTIIEMKAIG